MNFHYRSGSRLDHFKILDESLNKSKFNLTPTQEFLIKLEQKRRHYFYLLNDQTMWEYHVEKIVSVFTINSFICLSIDMLHDICLKSPIWKTNVEINQ